MLATASRPIASGISPKVIGNTRSDMSQCATTSLTVHASATATAVSDTDLTNLGWLQKPGVLSSVCTSLGPPQQQQHHGKPALRGMRRPRQSKSSGGRAEASPCKVPRSSDKMVNVILNVRNRKYNGEDASKPPLSFACMIFMAVESSPTKTLPVKGIYEWVMWKFPYYRNAPPGWKNSVRHNLSLNKCFKKVDRYCGKSGGAVSKGGLWTVDPDYRRSLLAALKRSPYHPYHSYFTPLSPSSSSSSLDTVDPAERDAALTMCMIGGGPDHMMPDLLHTVCHDHCYTKDSLLPVFLPPPQVTVKLTTNTRRTCSSGLTLDEIAAAAEMILAQDGEESDGVVHSDQSSDEGIGGEMDSDMEEDEDEGMEEEHVVCLGDSGYSNSVPVPSNTSFMDEMGADALLCLATGSSRGSSPIVA